MATKQTKPTPTSSSVDKPAAAGAAAAAAKDRDPNAPPGMEGYVPPVDEAAPPAAAPKAPGLPGRDAPEQDAARIAVTSMASDPGIASGVDTGTVVSITAGATTRFVVPSMEWDYGTDTVELSGFVGNWDPLNGVHPIVKEALGSNAYTVDVDSSAFGAAPAPSSITTKLPAGTPIPHIRCFASPVNIARLTVGDMLHFIIVNGSCPELDGQDLPCENPTGDSFRVTRVVAGSLVGVTAAVDFDEVIIPPDPDGPHPNITEYVPVFVHHRNVARAGDQVGYLTVTKADAAAMIGDGDAVSAYDLSFAGPYISDSDPWPPEPPPPLDRDEPDRGRDPQPEAEAAKR